MSENQEDGAERNIDSEVFRDDASLEQIVLAFVNGLNDRVSAMESAAREGDFESLRFAAHQLKSSGGKHGYHALTKQAASLEVEAQQRAVGSCLAALDEIKMICRRIVPEPPGQEN